MRTFAYVRPHETGVPILTCVTEKFLLENEYPAWKTKADSKRPDLTNNFSDFLCEWVMVNWAREMK